eukprot:3168017-Pyramimonas_sp.AAC.1
MDADNSKRGARAKNQYTPTKNRERGRSSKAPRAGRFSSRGSNVFDSPRTPSNRSAGSFSARGGCWNAGPTCPSRAENRCPGKARKPGGSCRRLACSQCSSACPNCSRAWLCNNCVTMEEHSCRHLAIQEWTERNRQDREQ